MPPDAVRAVCSALMGSAAIVPALVFAFWPGPIRPTHRLAPALVLGIPAVISLARAVDASGLEPGAVTRRTETYSPSWL